MATPQATKTWVFGNWGQCKDDFIFVVDNAVIERAAKSPACLTADLWRGASSGSSPTGPITAKLDDWRPG